MALVSLPHPALVGFKENELEVRRFHYNQWDVEAKNQDGSPVDLTGVTTMELSAYRGREIRGQSVHYVDEMVRLQIGGGLTVTDAAAGEVSIEIDPEQTEAVKPGPYWYDLWYLDGGSNRVLLIDKAEFRVIE